MRGATILTSLLVVVGALNWGLVGLLQLDLVAAVFGGQDAALSRIVYSLVGISGLVQLGLLVRALSNGSDVPELATRAHR